MWEIPAHFTFFLIFHHLYQFSFIFSSLHTILRWSHVPLHLPISMDDWSEAIESCICWIWEERKHLPTSKCTISFTPSLFLHHVLFTLFLGKILPSNVFSRLTAVVWSQLNCMHTSWIHLLSFTILGNGFELERGVLASIESRRIEWVKAWFKGKYKL